MNRTLLLTSTVSPKDNPYIGTIESRHKEYVQAVNWYIKNTPYQIVIIDNSDYDFKNDFPNNKRVEALHYNAPVQTKGKGYGELAIIDYGLKNSQNLNSAEQIVKITGRHIISNIMVLLKACTNPNAVYEDSNFFMKQAYTYFIVAPKPFYKDLIKGKSVLNDRGGYYLEHLAAKEIISWIWQRNSYHCFQEPLNIIGHSGVQQSSYKKPGILKRIKIKIKWHANEFRTFLLHHHIINKQIYINRINNHLGAKQKIL